jgi:hypothetical protein
MVPTEVKEELTTVELSVVPVNVPAAAVIVIFDVPLKFVPLIVRAVCNAVAVDAFPRTLPVNVSAVTFENCVDIVSHLEAIVFFPALKNKTIVNVMALTNSLGYIVKPLDTGPSVASSDSGLLMVNVSFVSNSNTKVGFTETDCMIIFSGGTAFSFPAASDYKKRTIILFNDQTSTTIHVPNTNLQISTSSISLTPKAALRATSTGLKWLIV